MANQEHLEIVLHGIQDKGLFSTWRQSYRTVILDLSGADLSNRDLSNLGLSTGDYEVNGQKSVGIDLSYANLTNTNFSGSSLQGALFSGANLQSTLFTQSHLEYANFDDAVINKTDFRGKNKTDRTFLDGVDFTKVDISGTTLFTNCQFNHCNFMQKLILNSDFSGCSFSDAKLNNTKFIDCNFSSTFWNHITAVQTSFLKANLSFSEFRTCEFEDLDIKGSDFREATFDRVKLTRVRNSYNAKNLETTNRSVTYFETAKIGVIEKYISWERIRGFGRLPIFSTSYVALFLVPMLIYGIDLYNDKIEIFRQWAFLINDEDGFTQRKLADVIKERLHTISPPTQMLTFFISTIFLAVASTLYTIFCPPRIKEYSHEKWVDELRQPLTHYWPLSWKNRPVRITCMLFYVLGALGILWVIGLKAIDTLIYLANYLTN